MTISPRSVAFIAALTAALLVLGCGDDDAGAPSDTNEATDAATGTVTITPEPTPGPTGVPASDERFQALLDEPGLVDFLRRLEAAVEENDADFVIDRTDFADYECVDSAGVPTEPPECEGQPGREVPAIRVSAWQSEGGYWGTASYEALIRELLTGEDADGAGMHALGQITLDDAEFPDVADAVIDGIGGIGELPARAEFAISLAIAERDGEWAITELSTANTGLINDFFEWWIAWDDFDAAAS